MTVFLTLVLALLVCVRVTVSCVVSVWLRAVRTGFYATECEGFRNRVFFFRKPVWAVVRKTTLRKLNRDMFQVRV